MAHAGTLAEDLESEVWDADGLSHNLCQSTPAVGLILLEPILSGRSSLQTLHVVGERLGHQFVHRTNGNHHHFHTGW